MEWIEETLPPVPTPSKSRFTIVEEIERDLGEGSSLLGAPGQSVFTSLGYIPFATHSINRQQLSATFMYMQGRKLVRSSSGTYKDNPRGPLWATAFGLVFLGYIYFRFINMQRDHEWESTSLWKEILLEFLLALVLSHASTRMRNAANSLTLFWIYLLVTGSFLLPPHSFRYLFLLTASLAAVTWMGYLMYYHVGPLLLRKSRYCFGWRRVKSRVAIYSAENRPGLSEGEGDLREVVFEYRPLLQWFTCSSPHTFVYRGQWKDGRPSGWGEWRDDSFYGESLIGFWE